MKFSITLITKAMLLSTAIILSSCGDNAKDGAVKGGTMGAATGAVGGLVTALIFGGDPAEAAARGMVYGGATGATAGAITGNAADSKIAEKRKAKAEVIRKKIGDDAFKGLSALLKCNHKDALSFSEKSKQSQNPNFSVSGYWLEILSYADNSQTTKVKELMPLVIKKDWNVSSDAEANVYLRTLQDKLTDARAEYKVPVSCDES